MECHVSLPLPDPVRGRCPAAGRLCAFADTAEPKATGSVAYRQHSMSAMAEHMAALKVVLIDQPALLGEAGVHAAAIAGVAVHPRHVPQGRQYRRYLGAGSRRVGPAG